MKLSIVIVLFLATSASAALVSGDDFFCLLDTEGVKCFGRGVESWKETPHVRFQNPWNEPLLRLVRLERRPDKVWAGSKSACAWYENEGRCWGDDPWLRDLPEGARADRIFLRPEYFCLQRGATLLCGDGKRVVNITAPSSHFFEDSDIPCVPGYCLRNFAFERVEFEAERLATNGDRVCASGEGIFCGRLATGLEPFDFESLKSGEEKPRQLLIAGSQVVVRYESSVRIAFSEKRGMESRLFKGARELAFSGGVLCGFGGNRLVCDPKFPVSGEVLEKVPLVGLGQRLDLLDYALRHFARYVVPPKKGLLMKIADLVERHPDEHDRLFVLNAILPLVENTRTEYIVKEILPGYLEGLARNNRAFGIHRLGDFKSPRLKEELLRLARAGGDSHAVGLTIEALERIP